MQAITIQDVLKYKSPQAIVDKFLYKQTLNLLTGGAGIGKSLLSLALAKSVITGERFLGKFDVKEKGAVLIIDEENPKPFLKERKERLNLRLDAPLFYLHYQQIKIDNPDHIRALLANITRVKPTLIIFDSLIRLHTAQENDNTAMATVMGVFRQLLLLTNSTILVIHHDRKSLPTSRDRARGAGDIVGAIDNQFSLIDKGEYLVLSTGKTRVVPIIPVKLKFADGSFKYIGDGWN